MKPGEKRAAFEQLRRWAQRRLAGYDGATVEYPLELEHAARFDGGGLRITVRVEQIGDRT